MLGRFRDAAARASKALLDGPSFHALPTRLPIIGFGAADLKRWDLQTDAAIGGYSECSLDSLTPSTALWSGSTALESDPIRQQQVARSEQNKVASKTGFVAMRADISGTSDLHEFHGLCIRMRPDQRTYVVNLRPEGVLGEFRQDDLYQAVINPWLQHARRVQEVDGELDDYLDVRIPWGIHFDMAWTRARQAPASDEPCQAHPHWRLTRRQDGGILQCRHGRVCSFSLRR